MVSTSTIFDEKGTKLEPYSPPIADFLCVTYALHENALRNSRVHLVEIPVSEPETWSSVGCRIEDLYYFLTGEQVQIQFSQAPRAYGVSRFRAHSLSKVALFSGGLDSGTYAVSLSKNRESALLFHVETSLMLFGRARDFHRRFVDGSIKLIRLSANVEPSETTTNTRALVILGGALAVAGELEIPVVVVPENGPMMLNPEVSTRAQASKTTNPWMIEEWTGIFNSVTRMNIRVETPYAQMTKSEVILHLKDKRALSATYSCFTSQGQSKMCGLCLACMVRMLSCLAAEVPETLTELYEHNWFTDEASLGSMNEKKLMIALDALEFWFNLAAPEHVKVHEEQERAKNLVRAHEILHRHSLDMFLGVDAMRTTLGLNPGPVGGRAIELLDQIALGVLAKRREQLHDLKEGRQWRD